MNEQADQLIFFMIAGEIFAIDLKDIAEIIPPQPLFPIPWTPPVFKGAINFHGRLVAILDLAEFMNIGQTGIGGEIIVLNLKLANLGFCTDQVMNIEFSDNHLEDNKSNSRFIDRLILLDEGEAGKLALPQIIAIAGESLLR
jgi:purine-binding chemotaxis protein CheW